MRHFTRHAAPDFLLENAERWNQQWTKLKNERPGSAFQWYRHQNQPVNQKLSPILSLQTRGHCSYCDAFPMGIADNTIDHFKPKGNTQFYNLAYNWQNLYLACADCQKAKGEKFDQRLLAPDAPEYSFDRYFIYNFNTHEIEILPEADEEVQNCARVTRDTIFYLNEPSRIISRRMAFETWFSPLTLQEKDSFPFRFMFDLVTDLP